MTTDTTETSTSEHTSASASASASAPETGLARPQKLTMLVHSEALHGTRGLALTAPYPLLIMDTNARNMEDTGVRIVRWNPRTEDFPAYTGQWDVCVADVQDWLTLAAMYDFLASDRHPFVSFVLDNVTEAQRMCRINVKPGDSWQQGDWGVLLNRMNSQIKDFRNLTQKHPTLRVALFVTESEHSGVRWEVSLQGAGAKAITYMTDILAFLSVEFFADDEGNATVPVRKLTLGIDPENRFQSGSEFSNLPAYMHHPNISTILGLMYRNEGVTA